MLHEWMTTWFHWVESWGYAGVFFMMALESSIVPIPSEVVMPPAAFWAAQGKMNFWGVVAAGTFGSAFGSAVSYGMARVVGLPFLRRYGKYILLPEDKLIASEAWVARNGTPGIFVARLLPVLRHLISYPAGVFRMPFGSFLVVTTIGAGIWCWILSVFGQRVLGEHPELLQSPAEMVQVMRDQLVWFVLAIVVFAALYVVMKIQLKRVAERKV